jgi:hypothetical protein
MAEAETPAATLSLQHRCFINNDDWAQADFMFQLLYME